MLHLFSEEYNNMKLFIPGNLTVHVKTLKTVLVSTLFFLTLLALPVIGCGIPSYPYLYPPEALSGGLVGFRHDQNNDPDVFRGYEIFYRFYAEDPDTAGTNQAESDMKTYFKEAGEIRSIVYGTSTSSAFTYGFRRLIIEGNTDADHPPQLLIDFADRSNPFTIEFTDYKTENEIRFTYDSVTYNVFRYVQYNNSNIHKLFLPASEEDVYDFTNAESDIQEENVDENNIHVAFFAVPYGTDPVSLAPLYANGSYEGMVYIGSFDLSF